MSLPLYFCLRIPEFAAQALVRLRPALAKVAVAVLEGEPPFEKACAATLQARRLGVVHGMSRAELESVHHLTILRRSKAEEHHAALALLEMAARFTPRVEELARTSAHTLALDMAGSTRMFGPPHVVGQKLFRAARELGFFSRVVSSQNLHTAICLARGPGNALITVPPGEERTFLHDLPLSALDLTEELLDTFTAWGLRTAGDLAALLPADLVARLGQQGHRLHCLASGQHDHLLVPIEPAFTLEEHLAFDAPVDNLESLLFVLAPMLDQLINRARHRALLLAGVTVCLHLERSADQADHDRNGDCSRATRAGFANNVTPAGQHASDAGTIAEHKPVLSVLVPNRDLSSSPTAARGEQRRPDALGKYASTGNSANQARESTPVFFSSAQPKPLFLPQTGPSIPTHERTLRPALPLDDRHVWLKLIQLDLQSHPAPAAIVAITLHAEPGPRPDVQSGLFSPQSPEPMRLEVTLARIAALVGTERVGQAVLTDNHQPESFRVARFTVGPAHVRGQNRPRVSTPRPEPSPIRTGVALRRLRPAPLVEVTHADGRPYSLRVQTSVLPTSLTVHRAFGPWRRSGHWWSQEVWSHEEWDIDAETADGMHLLALLTQDRLRSQWCLEAIYD